MCLTNNNQNYLILVVDDDESVTASLTLLLKQHKFKVLQAHQPQSALDLINKHDVSLVLQDMNFSRSTTGEEGMALLQEIKDLKPQLPVILMTAWASISLAVEGMRIGASDFIAKPWDNEHLLRTVSMIVGLNTPELNNLETTKLSRQHLDEQFDFSNVVGESTVMLQVLNTIARICKTDASVLILGESGTGKEVIADAIHNNSSRSQSPIVKVNLGGITPSLFESEMFGHVKGAFTDAKENRIGRVELGEQGTLFLDEIANIPLAQQAKLLRLLEEHQYEKVGASKTQQANIRVISATNSDLQQMVKEKSFRQDLLFRLNTFVVEIPPLRVRLDDILPMAEAFIVKCAARYNKAVPKLSGQAEQQLLSYQWPGNVRELSHTIERATLLASDEILPEHLMLVDVVNEPAQETLSIEHYTFEDEMTMDDIEKLVIEQRLKLNKGNAKGEYSGYI